MDFLDPRTSTGYYPARANLSASEISSHTFGNVYATGNAVIHLGDSIHSQQSTSTEGLPRLNGAEEKQSKAELQGV